MLFTPPENFTLYRKNGDSSKGWKSIGQIVQSPHFHDCHIKYIGNYISRTVSLLFNDRVVLRMIAYIELFRIFRSILYLWKVYFWNSEEKKYFTSKWKLISCGKKWILYEKINNREKNWTPLRRAIHRINGRINWNNHTHKTLKNWMKIHLL